MPDSLRYQVISLHSLTKKIAASLGVLGFLASAGVAFALTSATATTDATATVAAPAAAQAPVLQVGPNGKVLLRGTVASTASGSITVKGWGGDWTVNVPSTASVLPQGETLSNFQAGDFVGVQGTVDSSSNWTINATLIRDRTAKQALTEQIKTNVQAAHATMLASARTVQGTLSNLDATAQTFTLTNASGTAYSVSLASGAKLLASNWATLNFTKVNNGDTVRVFGSITGSALSASIFRDISVK